MTIWSESYPCLIPLWKGEVPDIVTVIYLCVVMICLFVLFPTVTCAEIPGNKHSAFDYGSDASGSGILSKDAARGIKPASSEPYRSFSLHAFPSYRYDSSRTFTRRSTYRGDYSVRYLQYNSVVGEDTVPAPSTVMRKSLILPGWGQVVNGQAWKVPVIYGMLTGLTYYSIRMNQSYRDYRAAFYNAQNPGGDQRFGPTPAHIDPNQNPESLRYNRNTYRNRRDLTLVGVVLAYGLNIVDAYVFAHMRDFDVSDDLSARFHIGPSPSCAPGGCSRFTTAPETNHGANRSAVMFTVELLIR